MLGFVRIDQYQNRCAGFGRKPFAGDECNQVLDIPGVYLIGGASDVMSCVIGELTAKVARWCWRGAVVERIDVDPIAVFARSA